MDSFKLGGVAVALWMAVAVAPAAAAAPPNDMFENATPLGDAPVQVSATTGGASVQPGEPVHGRQTVWHAFRPTVSSRVAVETVTSDGSDRVLGVYTGPSLAALASVGSSRHVQARVAFDAVAGETYWISTGRTYNTGPFLLRIRPMPLPPNDAFDAAITLSPAGGQHAGNLADATAEFGEEGGEHTVWYRVRAPRTGRMWITTSGGCAYASLYQGRTVDELELLRSGSWMRFDARRGRVYRISVDCNYQPGYGDYAIRISDGSIAGEGVEMTLADGQTLDSVRSSGLRLTVSALSRAEVDLELRVSRSTARSLGLDSRVIGRTHGRVQSGRPLPAVVRLTRRARRALDGETAVDATVVLELPKAPVRDRFLSQAVTL
jgi:hypothetical protein